MNQQFIKIGSPQDIQLSYAGEQKQQVVALKPNYVLRTVNIVLVAISSFSLLGLFATGDFKESKQTELGNVAGLLLFAPHIFVYGTSILYHASPVFFALQVIRNIVYFLCLLVVGLMLYLLYMASEGTTSEDIIGFFILFVLFGLATGPVAMSIILMIEFEHVHIATPETVPQGYITVQSKEEYQPGPIQNILV
ncbi:unnamed protein product [Moneuplotes crassus]|uniref:Uncharacterized protein n=1 Tax=Euplotes crassus TaxID=5936 RepID=A0AAD1XVC8_EUPCR|nr:unnamed protein product [Moneuplotes crassus]